MCPPSCGIVDSRVEPRELWERNTLLAEAFCSSDDKVRQAQAVLDEAQADRARTLAAFAVTVGSDGAVANLMGLNEREVRVARRTVGKEDARTVADYLISLRTEQPQPPAPSQQEPEPPAPDISVPHPRGETPLPTTTYPSPTDHGARFADETVQWSPGMDSVLQWSWQSGLDLQTVAEELGLNPRALLMRAQVLAAEGRLVPRATDGDQNRSGRHRRNEDPLSTPVPDTPESLYDSAAARSWSYD